ncbi:GPW/gp25 family protein [Amorphus sp. MBR-141]
MRAIRYRTGVGKNGGILRGWPHCAESLERIWRTRTNKMVMLLEFGSEHFSRLSEDITPELALQLYDDLATAAHRWEPEYRIASLQLVSLTRTGGLGIRHIGTYYPEGRLGNYTLAFEQTANVPLSLYRSSLGAAA